MGLQEGSDSAICNQNIYKNFRKTSKQCLMKLYFPGQIFNKTEKTTYIQCSSSVSDSDFSSIGNEFEP